MNMFERITADRQTVLDALDRLIATQVRQHLAFLLWHAEKHLEQCDGLRWHMGGNLVLVGAAKHLNGERHEMAGYTGAMLPFEAEAPEVLALVEAVNEYNLRRYRKQLPAIEEISASAAPKEAT